MTSNRLMAIAAGTGAGLVVGLALSIGGGAICDAGSSTRLVSDCDGALREVSIHYVQSFHKESFETLSDLFRALPSDVRVRVVVARQEEFDFLQAELARQGVPARHAMTAIVTGAPITPWAKDRFGTFRTRFGAPVLAVPRARSLPDGARANDERVPEIMARALPGLGTRPLPFFFDGGDLLCDSSNVYVASTLLARNRPWDTSNPRSLLDTIAAVLGRRVLPLGTAPEDVPDHHIGMYLTPLGNGVVAVGDPFLGRDLCLTLPDQGRDLDLEADEALYAPFLRVLHDATRQGLRVIHMPLVLTRQPRVYVTYNNAIVEVRGSGKRVYMPTYGCPPLDDAARRAYESVGFTVLPVRVSALYRNTGSLRCLVGIIRRQGKCGF